MSRNNINFDNKKIKISDFYTHKKMFNIDGIHVDKILVSKKYHIAKIIHLSALLDIMKMILLDHYL